jgi:hypothetical protein
MIQASSQYTVPAAGASAVPVEHEWTTACVKLQATLAQPRGATPAAGGAVGPVTVMQLDPIED